MKELIFIILLFLLFVSTFFVTQEIPFTKEINFSEQENKDEKKEFLKIVSLLPLKNEIDNMGKGKG